MIWVAIAVIGILVIVFSTKGKKEDECPECENIGCMKIVEGFVNIGNFFLRCEGCGYEWDD